jgi:uncharacterized protein YhdP
LETSFFHRLSNALWTVIVILIVLLAMYISAGRLLMANLNAYRLDILQELNVRVPFSVEAQRVGGEWHSFSPVIVLSELRLTFPDSSEAPLELSEGRIGVDVLNSLRTGSLQVKHIALTDFALRGNLSSDGRLTLTGFGSSGGEMGESAERLRDFLVNVEFITLRNNLLSLTIPNGEVRNFDLNLLLSRDGSLRRLDATLLSRSGMNISILADVVGEPLQ